MTFARMRRPQAVATGVAICIALLAAGTASARQWKATPQAMAQDYSMIQDTRPGELVMVFWLSPQMVDDKAIQEVLSKNLVVGALDAHVGADGKFSLVPLDGIAIKDSHGDTKHPLKDDDVPPTVAGGIQTIGAMFRQSLGPLGAGFHWYVFDGTNVKSCTPGSGFSVQVANENYTFDTPIPGCPKE